MADTCTFSTYGYACRKPVEHGRYLCEEHAAAKCSSCGQAATHGCDFCGQFVCGAPLCDECTFGTDSSKSGGSWGFMNHIHVSRPEFADKHENERLKVALAAKDAELSRLREALTKAADQLARVHEDAFKQAAGYGLVTSDGREFSAFQLNVCEMAAREARAVLTKEHAHA